MSIFSPLKKLFQWASPKSSFVESNVAAPPANIPPATPPKATPEVVSPPEPQPTLKQRILEGLPGFAMSAGSVMASKAVAGKCIAGLCASSSPLALAAAGVAASAVVGGVTAQTIEFTRNRFAAAQQQAASRGETLNKMDLIRQFSLAAAGRELGALGQEIKTKKFWSGALKKGGVSAALGGATGFALTEGLDWVKDTFFAKPPVAPLGNLITDHLPSSKPQLLEEAFQSPAPDVATPEVADLAPMPLNIDTVLDHARGEISEDALAAEMLTRADQGNAQAIKDMAVGFLHGKFGVLQNVKIGQLLLEKAASMGNAQALHDLGRTATKAALDHVAAAPAAALSAVELSAPALSDAAAPAFTAPTATELAAAKAAMLDTDSAIPTPSPVDKLRPAEAPPRIGSEAARCVIEQLDKGKAALRSLCSIFKDVMLPEDNVLMQNADGSLTMPYIHDGEAPRDTAGFMDQSRRDFRDAFMIPQMESSLQ